MEDPTRALSAPSPHAFYSAIGRKLPASTPTLPPILRLPPSRRWPPHHRSGYLRAFGEMDACAIDMLAGLDVHSRTLWILGMGRVGQAEARRSAGFDMTKPTAILINTCRGRVVEEATLARSLAERCIAAPGLDVFEHAPQVHPELSKCETSRLRRTSARFRSRCGSMVAVENAVAAIKGASPGR